MSGVVSNGQCYRHAVFAVFLLLIAGEAPGQEGLRVSLAGEQAAEARQRANGMPDYYNLKAGDFQLRLRSSLGIEANDNVTLVQSNRESDILFNPELGITASYPLSQENTLNLSVDAGYSFYLQHQNLNQLFVRPGTELSFDIFIKAVVLNVHDRVSVINQGYDNSSVGGQGNYVYLENSSGLSATWDLNLLELVGGFDHVERRSLSSSVNTQDGTEELFFGNAGLRVGGTSRVGVEVTTGIIHYDHQSLNGGVQYSAGLFYKAQLSENISARVSAGYFIYNLNVPNNPGTPTNGPPPPPSTNNVQSSVDALYGSISLTHRVNSRLNYSIDAGRQVQSGLFSDTLDLYYARLQASWGIVRKFPITGSFSYENGSESGGLGEKIERLGYGAGVSRVLTRKLNAGLWYQGYWRNSNLASGRYRQNTVTLTFSYRF